MIPLFAIIALASSQVATPPAFDDFSDELNAPDNAIRSCAIVHRADGDHVRIAMAKHGAGNAIRISYDTSISATYDYVFANRLAKKGRLRYESKALGALDEIDTPVRAAIGLTETGQAVRIFTKSGSYSITIGFAFREEDEPEIYGACRVAVTAE